MDGTLNLPTNVLIATIRKYRDQLSERFDRIKNGINESTSLSQPTAISSKPSGSGARAIRPRPTKIIPLKPYRERTDFEKVVVSMMIKSFNLFIFFLLIHVFFLIAALRKCFFKKSRVSFR